MGQRANSGRNASLDNKKARAAGRQQNEPSRQALIDRQGSPPVDGAFGKEGKPKKRSSARGAEEEGD